MYIERDKRERERHKETERDRETKTEIARQILRGREETEKDKGIDR